LRKTVGATGVTRFGPMVVTSHPVRTTTVGVRGSATVVAVTEAEQLVAGFCRTADATAPTKDATDALTEMLVIARAAWPMIDVAPAELGEAIGHATVDGADPAAAIRSLHVADLWLAIGCGAGDRVALAELERLLATLRPTLARMGATAAVIDELLQTHRTRLLSGTEDHPPRIRGYRGRGDLRSWLKVALVRDAVRALRRDDHVSHDDDEVERLMDPQGDAELQAMKDAYRDRFRVAFAQALADLEPRDRNVLRYHLLDGLAIDDIGAIYRVHRATAARWLVKIREDLYERTRAELMRSLAVGPSEIDSVLRLIRSRLDASIARGLAEPAAT
jgi:RNA polymerase sigma-70 factor (ECF subfamily)